VKLKGHCRPQKIEIHLANGRRPL